MNCKYCKELCQPDGINVFFDQYDCKNCNVYYYYEKNGALYSEYLCVHIGNNTYNVRKCHFDNHTDLYNNGYESTHIITTFPFIADEITPTNIQSKVKTILVFR